MDKFFDSPDLIYYYAENHLNCPRHFKRFRLINRQTRQICDSLVSKKENQFYRICMVESTRSKLVLHSRFRTIRLKLLKSENSVLKCPDSDLLLNQVFRSLTKIQDIHQGSLVYDECISVYAIKCGNGQTVKFNVHKTESNFIPPDTLIRVKMHSAAKLEASVNRKRLKIHDATRNYLRSFMCPMVLLIVMYLSILIPFA